MEKSKEDNILYLAEQIPNCPIRQETPSYF